MRGSKKNLLAIRLKAALVTFSLILGFVVVSAPPSRADSLEVLGGVVSWPDKMYLPDGCSNFSFQYINNTGVRLLQLGFIITDPFGRKVEDSSQIGIDPGKSGAWNDQICSSSLKNGLGPYIVKVYVEDYTSTQREITKEIFFLPIPGGTSGSSSGLNPTPKPTVAPQPADLALAQLVATLTAKVNALNAKLKRICSVKPKPKGC